jgi:hypothetical protein
MRSFLALMFYLDYKCRTQPAFGKTFLVLTLLFVFFLWSPWRPLLCPVFGICPAPVVQAHSSAQSKPKSPHRVAPSKLSASVLANEPVLLPVAPHSGGCEFPLIDKYRGIVAAISALSRQSPRRRGGKAENPGRRARRARHKEERRQSPTVGALCVPEYSV